MFMQLGIKCLMQLEELHDLQHDPVHSADKLNPICHGLLGPDRFPRGGSKCPDSIQPTILMIFQILFLQGLRYVYKGLETKI